MSPEQDGATTVSKVKVLSFERIALIGILVLQVAILLRTDKAPVPPPSTPSRSAGLTPASVSPAQQNAGPETVAAPDWSAGFPLLLSAPTPHDMHIQMERMLEDAMAGFERMESFARFDDGWASLRTSPAMDVHEDTNRYVVTVSLPGPNSPPPSVSLDGRLLTVVSQATEGSGGLRSERQFARRILLPGPVRQQDAAAYLTNGVLRVELPKSADGAQRHEERMHVF